MLPLWVAEMDTVPAPVVSRAIRDMLASGDTGYPYGRDYPEALAAFALERWGWSVDVDLIRPVTDVMNGIVEALALVTGPGDAVVLTPPVYAPFYGFVTAIGRRLVMAPLGEDGRLDLGNLKRAMVRARELSDRAALVLANPHNPTGTVHTRRELTAVAALATRFRVRVVVDEIHAPLTYDDARFTPYLTVPGGDSGFSVISASKGWNLAGFKAALLIGGAASAVDLARMPEVHTHGASSAGVLAHATAFRAGTGWLDEHRAALDLRRTVLRDLLAEHLPEVGFRVPDATFLAWLDCRPLGLGADPAEHFLHRARVALNGGPWFGPGGEGHVRLNFATSIEVLTEAVTADGFVGVSGAGAGVRARSSVRRRRSRPPGRPSRPSTPSRAGRRTSLRWTVSAGGSRAAKRWPR